MRVLFIGDVVGSMGREMITEYLPRLKKKYRPQVTIVNGENAASGRGITEKIYKKFFARRRRCRDDGESYVGQPRNL